MTATRKAVQIIWHDAQGTQKITLDFISPSTAEAVCMMLDHMESSGLDLEAIDGLAIIAKSGHGAEMMMAADEAEFKRHQEQRDRAATAREAQACAA